MDDFGFIITRHVNSELTNKYWNNCVKCLRKFYPFKKIIIIDDNSNMDFVKSDNQYDNIRIIQSEFKGRGELLPYYYFLKEKFFENAIIIHDSVFFHKRIAFEKLKKINVIPLWFFYPDKENVTNTIKIMSKMKNIYSIQDKILLNNNILGMEHTKWYGCFGVQSYINHSFLTYLEAKYNLTNMMQIITCRKDRCCLERILGAIFYTEYPKILSIKSIFGDIMKYQKWGYNYKEYEISVKHKILPQGVVKVWTGR
jgi:hypothetical protein